MIKYVSLFLSLLVLTTLIGCGSGHVSGSGTVKYSSGEPVPSGVIFFSTPQLNYTGTIKDGVFELGGLKEKDGLPPGTYNVHLIGTEPDKETSADIPFFASRFNDPTTSGIVIEVKAEEKNSFEIIVEKPE